MHLDFGKRVQAGAIGSCSGLIPTLSCSETGLEFALDTGAAISILPRVHGYTGPPTATAETANGGHLSLVGSRHLNFTLQGIRYSHKFQVGDVLSPIIGCDFLEVHGLGVHLTPPLLRSSAVPVASVHPQQSDVPVPSDSTQSSVPVLQHSSPPQSSAPPPPQPQMKPRFSAPLLNNPHIVSAPVFSGLPTPKCTPPARVNRISAVMNDFQDVFSTTFSTLEPRHGVKHDIVTDGGPFATRARRLAPDLLAKVKKDFDVMEAQGIVRRSKSPWGSPLLCVKKPSGDVRACGDYRRLNAVTRKDRYPLPLLRDFQHKLNGMKCFSTLDMCKAYYQVPLTDDAIPKTAVITPFGSYEFLSLPFGVCNAVPTFQRLADCLFAGIPFIFVYIDDILVFSPDEETHEQHLREVLHRLRSAGLCLNPNKCVFFASQVDFLGHKVDSTGISPLDKHMAAIADFQRPDDLKSLQRFLGMVNFYRSFVPGMAHMLKPLTDLLGKDVTFHWGTAQQLAFDAARSALHSVSKLQHFRSNCPLRLTSDASNVAIACVLEQFIEGRWAPLEFWSRKLRGAELRYAAFDRELLASFESVKKFRHLLAGVQFDLRLDHRPVVQAFSRKSDCWNDRQARQLSFISEFDVNPIYLPGHLNTVADALSRAVYEPAEVNLLPSPAASAPSRAEFVAAQSACSESRCLMDSSLVVTEDADGLLVDTSTGGRRVVVPVSLRQRVLAAVHALHHPGIRATQRLLSRDYVWSRMASDAAAYVRNCLSCSRAKVTSHLKPAPCRFPADVRRFQTVHLDIVGPFSSDSGFRYLLTMVDRATRWPECQPMTDISAATVAETFVTGWISRYGVPQQVISDRGTQFLSSIFTSLTELLGVGHTPTTAYHPECNGMVERLHRRIKDSFRAIDAGHSWVQALPWVMLGLRASPRDVDDISSFENVFGTPPVLPGSLLERSEPDLASIVQRLKDQPALPVRPPPLQLSRGLPAGTTHVFVREEAIKGSPLQPRYRGPYRVLRQSRNTVRLRLGDREDTVAVSRLKPCLARDPVEARPPARGRPSGGRLSRKP